MTEDRPVPQSSTKNRRKRAVFRIRAVFALTAGFACIYAVSAWLLRGGASLRVLLLFTVCATGSLVGMAVASHRKVSKVTGSLIGGGAALLAVYLMLAALGAIPFSATQGARFVAAALIFSAALSAIVGIVAEGFTIYRSDPPDERHSD